jgi:hypothetical protein
MTIRENSTIIDASIKLTYNSSLWEEHPTSAQHRDCGWLLRRRAYQVTGLALYEHFLSGGDEVFLPR